jgi:predicted ThiF/HesA family dinucleotide-utilizing enzyme
VWPEGLCRQKNPMTPLGIEPVTSRLVVQCLNILQEPQVIYNKTIKPGIITISWKKPVQK